TTALQFTDASATIFREPTLLNRPNIPTGSGLVAAPASTNALFTNFHANFPSAGFSTTTGAITAVNNVLPYTAYLGVYLGTSPVRWVATGSDSQNYILSAFRPRYLPLTSNHWTNDQFDFGFTYRLQYQD